MARRERERCEQCGFDSDDYDRDRTVAAQSTIAPLLAAAIEGLDEVVLGTRPAADTWSIGEYLDHVRETAFGNRFAIEVARAGPGTDLGSAPEPVFAADVRVVDAAAALDAIADEFAELERVLSDLTDNEWNHDVVVDGAATPIGWFARHVLHDALHHRDDIDRIRRDLVG